MDYKEFDNTTLDRFLSTQSQAYANNPFVKLGEQSWTYQQFAEEVDRLAAGLVELGLRPTERLAVILPNIPEFVMAVFTAAKTGLIFVPINIRRSPEEIQLRLAKTGAKAVITFSDPEDYHGLDHIAVVLSARDDLPELDHVISISSDEDAAVGWQSLLQSAAEIPALENSPGDAFAIIHTLGNSGTPRGAVLTHRGLIGNAARIAEGLAAAPEDVFLGAVPFSNTFGLTATILASMVVGATLVCQPRYHPNDALALVAQEKISIHNGVPTMFAMELNHPDFKKTTLSSLRTGVMAGAPCPPELVKRVHREMGCRVLVAYGLTEVSPGVTSTRLDDGPVTATQSVGKPLADVEIKVTDEGGKTLPPGTEGELWVRGPNVMLEYWNDPEATQQVMDPEGWLNTGDLAVISPDGIVQIVGRKDDVIIRSGFKIYPKTVEMTLRTHPAVKEAVVVGVPDLIYGELIYACVVKRAGTDVKAGELLAFAEERLAEYSMPDRILFFDRLPRRGSGVIRKNYLRERVRIRGQAWTFGANVDTDAIIPARRCNTADPEELALFCMEDADPDFVNKMQRGDLIVADTNFGCGSSREVAPLAIKAAGVSAVIAKSFARIFFRNAINIGLPILESPEAVKRIEEGDEVEVEPALGIIRNLTKDQTYQAEPFPDFLRQIIDRGGLLAYVEDRLEKQNIN